MSRFTIGKNQRGDTIMEVLICVAMLGFMLGAAFSLTNKNQLSARASQERSEAVRLAERQVEYIRTYYAKNPGVTPANTNFCFDNNGTYTANGTPNAEINNDNDDTKYVTTCKDTTNGYDYKISFWRADMPETSSILGSKGSAHVVTVRWDNIKGVGKEEVKMFYTIDQLSAGYFNDDRSSGEAWSHEPACSNNADDDNDLKVDFDGNGRPADKDVGCNSLTDNTETDPAQLAIASMRWAEREFSVGRNNSRQEFQVPPVTCLNITEDWERDKFPSHNWPDNYICYDPGLAGNLTTYGATTGPPAGDYSKCALLDHPSKRGVPYQWSPGNWVWADNYICSSNTSIEMKFITDDAPDPTWIYCMNITESSDSDWKFNPKICLREVVSP